MLGSMVVIIALVLVMIASLPIVNALPKMDPEDPGICLDTGKKSGSVGAAVFKCCWHELVSPGTGGVGENLDKEEYCMECEDGGTRGYINCTDPELQYRDGGKPLPPLSGTINNGQISDNPLTSNNDNPNPGIAPKGGLAGGIENLQSNNNMIQASPDSG